MELTPDQAKKRTLELLHETNLISKRKSKEWMPKTKEELEQDCPSLKDGLDPKKLATWRRQVIILLQKVGMQVRIPQWGIAMAALLCHRFFSRKSMKKNDRFIVATACLHLAAKVEESPKPIREIVKEATKIIYARKGEQGVNIKLQPANLESLKEEVLVAERAILYTLGFELTAQHPYSFLIQKLSQLGLLQANVQDNSPYKMLMQNTWNFINDSFRTTLCLQMGPERIAYSALYLANVINTYVSGVSLESKLKDYTKNPNMDFHQFFRISLPETQAVSAQILHVYSLVELGHISRAAEGAALSAAMRAREADAKLPKDSPGPGQLEQRGEKRPRTPQASLGYPGLGPGAPAAPLLSPSYKLPKSEPR